jgi:lysyl-tRNA synthetase class 1
MIWVDRMVEEIKKRNLSLEIVDDMKTPSGKIHVGALRGVVIHDLVYKVLKENKVNTKYTYVFDDHDPMDSIPLYLDYNKWEKYAGMQLYKIPSPFKGFKNYAYYYSKEFIDVFNSIGCHPEIIWTSKLYNSGMMNDAIIKILNNAKKVKLIYKKFTKKTLPVDWHPFNVVCENCRKLGTTYVYKWDRKFVYYKCLPGLVKWARGCGYQSKILPLDGTGKLPWKVEWAAKWMVLGVTVEGAGKDHMSKGGSHDIASAVCKDILNYPVPYPLTYEHYQIGGRKMSSSKGLGASAKEMSGILPPNLLRFLIVRSPIQKAIEFDPKEETIIKLYDDYDICIRAYFNKIQNKIQKGKQGETTLNLARIFELSYISPLPKIPFYISRFRTIYSIIKTGLEPLPLMQKQKGSKLTVEEISLFKQRVMVAKKLMERTKEQDQNQIEKIKLTKNQVDFFHKLAKNFGKTNPKEEGPINKILFYTIKQYSFKPKDIFPALYFVLIGKKQGPRAAELIKNIGIKKTIEILETASI